MHDHKAPQLIQIAPLEPQVAPVQREIRAQRPHDHQTRFLVTDERVRAAGSAAAER